MPQQKWTREQDLAVLYLKLEYAGRLTPKHPGVLRLARAMRRTEASICKCKRNFDSMDPAVPGAGLGNAAKLTKDIWAEYEKTRMESWLRPAGLT